MERSGQLCLGTEEGLSNWREELAGSGLAHPPPEAEGSGEGNRAKSAPEMAPPTKLQIGFQFPTKDFLRFWWLTSAGRVAATDQLPRTDTRDTQPACAETEAGTTEGRRCRAPGRVCSSSSWLPELLRPGKAQTAGPTESALLWSTRKLELHATQGPLPIEQPGAWAV